METRLGRLQALLLGAVLAIGAGLAWGVAVGLLGMTVEGLFPAHVTEPGRHEQLHVQPDGTLVIDTGKQGENGIIYRTLDGKRAKGKVSIEGVILNGPDRSEKNVLDWGQRIVRVDNPNKHFGKWFFVHDGASHGRGYFIGYDTETNLKIGCIGRNGFQYEIPPVEEQFALGGYKMSNSNAIIKPYSYNNTIILFPGEEQFRNVNLAYLAANNALLEIDLEHRTVKHLWEGNNLISARRALKDPPKQIKDLKQTWQMAQVYLLRTPDKVIVLDFDGKLLSTYVLPEDMRNIVLSFCYLPDGQALVRKPGIDDDLFWIDTAGKIVRHERVDLFHKNAELYYPWPYLAAKNAMALFALPSPGGIVSVLICNPWDIWKHSWRTRAMDYPTALWQALKDTRLLLSINGVLAVIMAVFCFRRQRKYGLPWTGVWVGFVLLFGLPAYFGYLAHRVWPARLACPNCGKRVPRDRVACFACGQEFPLPAHKGIEVFA